MTPTASPGNERSTHHVVLSGGGTNVGLVLCDNKGNATPLGFDRTPIESGTIKITQGLEKYSDLDLPYETVVQDEWGGGRGSEDFDKDSSMYYSANGINTLRGSKAFLGGLPNYILSASHRGQAGVWPRFDEDGFPFRYVSQTINNSNWVAAPFTPTADFFPAYFYFVQMRLSGVTSASYLIEIRESVGGLPGTTVLYSGYVSASGNPYEWELKRVLFTSGSIQLKAGTQYFVVIKDAGLNPNAAVLMTNSYVGSAYFSTDQGSSWTSTTQALFFRVVDDEKKTGQPGLKSIRAHFAEYKGALYVALEYDDGAATPTPSRLFGNGAHNINGVATGTQTVTTLQDTSRAWATNAHKGSIVKIVRGTGSEQARPWRIVVYNDATTLTVNEPWDVIPVAGSSEYAIIHKGDQLFEVGDFYTKLYGSSGAIVKDILAANGALYFATGDSTALIRLVQYNNAGTWTWDWSDFGSYVGGSAAETGKFSHLLYAGDEAGNFVWGAKAGFPPQLYKAAAIDFTGSFPASPSLTFKAFDGANGNVGDLYERITGLTQYGELGNVHVLKEGSVHRIYNGRAFRISTEEQRVSHDYRTGKAKTTKGSYLFFAWHDTVIRYYEGVFDNIGPNKGDMSLPKERRGEIAALVTYPGMLIAAIDAGKDGYSSVMAYNDQGWHDLFVAPDVGLRIRSLYVQSLPGNLIDRLWFTCGIDIMWLPLSIDPVNHPHTDYYFYPFIWGGILRSSYYYLGMNDIQKHYKKLKFLIEPPLDGETATLYYNLRTYFSATPVVSNAITISSPTTTYAYEISVDSNRLTVGVIFHANNNSYTPSLETLAIDAVKRFEQDYRTVLLARLQDRDVDLLGQPDEYVTALSKYNALAALRALTGPVTMTSMIASLDGLSVFVDGLKIRPVWEHFGERDRGNVERYLIEIALVDA